MTRLGNAFQTLNIAWDSNESPCYLAWVNAVSIVSRVNKIVKILLLFQSVLKNGTGGAHSTKNPRFNPRYFGERMALHSARWVLMIFERQKLDGCLTSKIGWKGVPTQRLGKLNCQTILFLRCDGMLTSSLDLSFEVQYNIN